MTIAIAAFGPGAGKAVFQGMLAAEVLGRGSIGGFTVFSVLDGKGIHRQSHCQDGGVVAAVDDATKLAAARCAAVISSGPDRPEPLSQFLVGRSGVGLVSGHRLPNRIGVRGAPVNLSTLAQIEGGYAPTDAIRDEVQANRELDFGLVAVTWDGRIGYGNSCRVARRSDLGFASRVGGGRGFAMLCNSIHAAPGVSIDDVVGQVVWGCLTDTESPYLIAELAKPVPLVSSHEDRIDLDGMNQVVRIGTAEPQIGRGAVGRATVIYSRAFVWRGNQRLGHCMSDIIARVANGQAVPEPACQNRFVVERISDDAA